MKFMSFFSGIEAASVAWKPLGWECVSVSEIDEFASAVLAHRYPNVPNLGDITKVSEEQLNEIKRKHNGIDLIIGGSPCQSFSIAGLRKGLQDPRGNLMLEYARIVHTVRPRWFIWENVVGALSTNGGRDFGTLLTTMAKFGYSLQWRVLDAQFYGVAQRRRRVFLVGYLGTREGFERVLFEPRCGKGNNSQSQNEWGFNSPEIEDGIGGDHSELGEMSLEDMLFGGMSEPEPEPQPKKETPKKKPFVMPSRWNFDESAFVNVAPTLTTKGSVRVVEDKEPIWMFPTTQPKGVELFGKKDKAGTLVAGMGAGGGMIPMIVEDKKVWLLNGNLIAGIQTFGKQKVCPTLLAAMGGGGGNSPYVIEDKEKPKVFITRGDNWGAIAEGRYDHVAPTLVVFVGSRPLILDEKPQKVIVAGGSAANQVGDARYDHIVPTLCVFNGSRPIILEEKPNFYHSNYSSGKQYDFPITKARTMLANMYKDATICPLVLFPHKKTDNVEYSFIQPKEGSLKGSRTERNNFSFILGSETIQKTKYRNRIRKLTERECERLQGFPDDWTLIEYKGKPKSKCPRSPRYKCLGNSMAVPVIEWIGRRIEKFETGMI